jgi:hypothetical protein
MHIGEDQHEVEVVPVEFPVTVPETEPEPVGVPA